MKIRFIIKEQVAQSTEDLQNKLNDAMTAAIQNLDTVPDPVVAQNLINQALQLLNQAAGTAPQTTPSPTLGEKKEKTNCFAAGKYKTFKGKSKCIQRTKGLSKNRADAYTASVLRDMGELPK